MVSIITVYTNATVIMTMTCYEVKHDYDHGCY